jgi:hypothetical protein
MIGEALRFPFKGQDWIRKMLGGYILVLASFLIVPSPLFLGYILRVMREETMPGFDNLVQMYVDGLKALAVVILYMTPGILLLAAFEGALALIGFLFLIIGWWGFESGLYYLANEGFREAFTTKALKTVFTLDYFIGILASIIIPFGIAFVYVLSLLTILPILLFPAVQFYQAVIRYRIMKNAIEKA